MRDRNIQHNEKAVQVKCITFLSTKIKQLKEIIQDTKNLNLHLISANQITKPKMNQKDKNDILLKKEKHNVSYLSSYQHISQ